MSEEKKPIQENTETHGQVDAWPGERKPQQPGEQEIQEGTRKPEKVKIPIVR